MATNVGWATLSVIPSFDGFRGRLERGTTPALTTVGNRGGAHFGDVAGKTAGQRFGRIFTATARTALIGGAGAAALAVKVGSDSIGLASDLAESQNKVNVVFKDSSRIVRRFGRDAAKSIGLSEQKALEAAGTYGNLFVNLGVGEKQSAKMSRRMVRLAADLASFNNIAPEEALERLRSGLLGEQEAVERLGISITEQGLKQRAFDLGLTETTKGVLPAAIRTQAAYAEIIAQTGLAQGDFTRTSDQLANKQRILSARWDDARAKLGTALLPLMEDFVDLVIDRGIPAFEDFSDWFVEDGIPAIEDLGRKLKPLKDELLPAAADGFRSIKNFAEDALPFAEGIVGAFNDLPGWVKNVLIAGAGGGLAAKKLGLGKVGGSLLSKGGTPANPLYVFDVNGGDGPGGTKTKGGGILKSLGLALAIGAGMTAAFNSLPKEDRNSFVPGIGGFAGDGGLSLPSNFLDFSDDAKEKQRAFNQELSRTQRLFVESKAKANDYGLFVKHGLPTEIRFSVLGLDTANAKARDLYATLLDIRSLHMDTRLDRAGGSGTAPNSGINPRGGVFIASQTVVAHDYKDFVQQSRRRSIAAAGEGMSRR